jgi:hypothetical protein
MKKNTKENENKNDGNENKNDSKQKYKCDCKKEYVRKSSLKTHQSKCIIYKVLTNEIDLSDPNSINYINELKKKKKKKKTNDKQNLSNSIDTNSNCDNSSKNIKIKTNIINLNNKLEINNNDDDNDDNDDDNDDEHDEKMNPSLVTQMINNIITTNPNIITNPYNYVNQKYINKNLSSDDEVEEDDDDIPDNAYEELDLDKAVIYKIDKEKFIDELSIAISNHIYEQLAKIIDSHNNSILEKYNKIIEKCNKSNKSIT